MGGGSYSSTKYKAAVDHIHSTGAAFARSATAVSSGNIRGNISEILDPRKLKNGIRESCFVDGFNDADAIAVGIDGTGSMRKVPEVIQKGLPDLIDTVVDRGISDHPNVMFICFDDENSIPPDAAFQMSQFEIGATELVESLNNLVIPGQGGGNDGESYHLFFYALANHTRIESFERDGRKGYAFLICDEQPIFDRLDYTKRGTSPEVAKATFEDTIEKEVSMLESVRKTAEKYHVFILRPHHTCHGEDVSITRMWQDLLEKAGVDPEHVMEIKDPNSIISTMVLAIGRLTGVDSSELVSVLRAKGASGIDDAAAATKSLVPVSVGAVAVGTASSEIVTSDVPVGGRKR